MSAGADLVILATVADGDVLEGTRALERADWEGARRSFSSALEAADVPEARAGLGLAQWFLGRIAEGIAQRERAFEGLVAERRCDEAARVAVWVSHQHLLGGRASAARGWLARAQRCLEGAALSCVGRGWVAVELARHAASPAEQVQHAGEAVRIAREHLDGDLEVFALSQLGRAVVLEGRREPGLRLLEEAMAAATSGRVRSLHTLGEAYCNLVDGCATAGEWERCAEWCQLVEEFAHEHRIAPLFGACRTVHARVLLATGHWTQAEDALQSALAATERTIPHLGAPAVAELAELRLRQGRLLDAERLLADREGDPSAQRSLALLRLAEDRPREAAALLDRLLDEATDQPVRAASLLAPLVDARLACGEVELASAAAQELAELAGATQIRVVQAQAELAAARVVLATGHGRDAAAHVTRALAAFRLLAMPFAAGQARLELARALADEHPELARDEARTALTAFQALGAAQAMDAAAAVLRALGGGTAPRPRASGDLTAREREVLDLVALGMSNARIAASLVISEKTVGHHVSHILAKLGVQNRTEAASYAVRVASSAGSAARSARTGR